MSKRFIRSPSYPSLSLKEAVEAVRKIEQQYRSGAVDRADAAKLIGYKSLSGPAHTALAALAAFGLLERAGKGDARVTERARAILHPDSPEERREQLKEAAGSPPLFKKLRERFPGSTVPPEEGVRTYLNRENFNPNSVRRAASAFLRTAEYLDAELGNDSRLHDSVDREESTAAGPTSTDPVVPRVGDFVQWESQGAWQFAEPRRVRAVSDDGNWAFVEDSTTGLPMSELTVEKAAQEPPDAPVLPVKECGEVEWLRSHVGRDTSVRLMVRGNVGSREIDRLIRVLKTQREVILEDEQHLEAGS